MGKFRDSGAKEIPAISTASLPDIIFMLLFFFMISTSMKEVDYQVQIRFPEATELQSLEKKNHLLKQEERIPQHNLKYGKI